MRGADARNCGALAGASTTVPSDDLGVLSGGRGECIDAWCRSIDATVCAVGVARYIQAIWGRDFPIYRNLESGIWCALSGKSMNGYHGYAFHGLRVSPLPSLQALAQVSAVILASDRGAALRSAGWSPVVFNSRVPAGGRTRLSAVRPRRTVSSSEGLCPPLSA